MESSRYEDVKCQVFVGFGGNQQKIKLVLASSYEYCLQELDC